MGAPRWTLDGIWGPISGLFDFDACVVEAGGAGYFVDVVGAQGIGRGAVERGLPPSPLRDHHDPRANRGSDFRQADHFTQVVANSHPVTRLDVSLLRILGVELHPHCRLKDFLVQGLNHLNHYPY